MLDYIDSHRSNSEYYDLGQVVLERIIIPKNKPNISIPNIIQRLRLRRWMQFLRKFRNKKNDTIFCLGAFGINDLKKYYYENRDKVDPSKVDHILVTTRYDSFLFYVTMISHITMLKDTDTKDTDTKDTMH
jgi:hypothetical protein